jgi:Uma2 family endonuclease
MVAIPPTIRFTPEQFEVICAANRDLRLELTATGELIEMPPTGGETGRRNSDLNLQLGLWNRQAQLGVVFDSSTAFRLPNGAIYAPDVAWIKRDRWAQLTPEQRQGFPPLAPDFVIELASPSDSPTLLRQKMLEYRENGVKLGWLILPEAGIIEVYRDHSDEETLQRPETLSGETVLPGFTLSLAAIWS